MAPARLLEEIRGPVPCYPSISEDVGNLCGSSQPIVELSSSRKSQPNAERAYKQGIWTVQELLILQAVRREDIVRRKEGFERQLSEGLAQKELKSRVERWQEIEEACWARGVYRSAEQCQSRWEFMSREWRRINHHEIRCRRFGEPSYWSMTPAERTQKGLVSNFYYELYQALSEWVEKLTRNVPFHQCLRTSEAALSDRRTECRTGDFRDDYDECPSYDTTVDAAGTSCSGQTRTGRHDVVGQSCSEPMPHIPGSHPYQFPMHPSLGTCGSGAMFSPFPYPPPWVHPPPYSMAPNCFHQLPANLCSHVPVQTPSASPVLSGIVPSNITPPCVCRAASAGLSNTSCCASFGTMPMARGHYPPCTGTCQSRTKHSIPATNTAMDPSPVLPRENPFAPPKSSQEATGSVFITDSCQGLADFSQLSQTGIAAPNSRPCSHHPCPCCPAGPVFLPSFDRHLPPLYGAPVYLPYPCPRCNLDPFGYGCQPVSYRGQSWCPSSGPPFWGTPDGKAPKQSSQTPPCAEVVGDMPAGVGVDRQQTDEYTTQFQEYPVRNTYEESQVDVEDFHDDDETSFVLTDEWAEFFAKSAAKRREKKRQQQREAKAARKAAKEVSTFEEDGQLSEHVQAISGDTGGEVGMSSVEANHPGGVHLGS